MHLFIEIYRKEMYQEEPHTLDIWLITALILLLNNSLQAHWLRTRCQKQQLWYAWTGWDMYLIHILCSALWGQGRCYLMSSTNCNLSWWYRVNAANSDLPPAGVHSSPGTRALRSPSGERCPRPSVHQLPPLMGGAYDPLKASRTVRSLSGSTQGRKMV